MLGPGLQEWYLCRHAAKALASSCESLADQDKIEIKPALQRGGKHRWEGAGQAAGLALRHHRDALRCERIRLLVNPGALLRGHAALRRQLRRCANGPGGPLQGRHKA